jgi:formylglycine-generating enzyme required for sulfatase activity
MLSLVVGCGGNHGDGNLDAGVFSHGCQGCYYLLVEAGSFWMGCDPEQEPDCEEHPEATPYRQVFLDSFLIMRTEIEAGTYQQCIDAGSCTPPEANFPVTDAVRNVTWDQAQSFCAWAEARLPTEAEWEKTARGVDGRSYPWGNVAKDASDCPQTNYQECGLDRPFGSGDDVSPYRAWGIGGNLSEWVGDYYDASYYSTAPAENPPGPLTGSAHVARDGSFADPMERLRTWIRGPGQTGDTVGFRCAVSWPLDGTLADAGTDSG